MYWGQWRVMARTFPPPPLLLCHPYSTVAQETSFSQLLRQNRMRFSHRMRESQGEVVSFKSYSQFQLRSRCYISGGPHKQRLMTSFLSEEGRGDYLHMTAPSPLISLRFRHEFGVWHMTRQKNKKISVGKRQGFTSDIPPCITKMWVADTM